KSAAQLAAGPLGTRKAKMPGGGDPVRWGQAAFLTGSGFWLSPACTSGSLREPRVRGETIRMRMLGIGVIQMKIHGQTTGSALYGNLPCPRAPLLAPFSAVSPF